MAVNVLIFELQHVGMSSIKNIQLCTSNYSHKTVLIGSSCFSFFRVTYVTPRVSVS